MENRITDLEIRITHQDASIEELTRTVLEQEKLIRKLQQEMKTIRNHLKEFSHIAHSSEETPPPHY